MDRPHGTVSRTAAALDTAVPVHHFRFLVDEGEDPMGTNRPAESATDAKFLVNSKSCGSINISQTFHYVSLFT